MPGTTIRVMPKQAFDFTNLAAGSSSLVLIAKGVDLSSAISGELVVRVHSLTITGSNVLGSFSVFVKPDAPTPEEPHTDFVMGLMNLAHVCLVSPQSLPSFSTTNNAYSVPLVAPLPAAARVYVQGFQGASGATALTATLSADLVLHW